jgi:photoactive yellow protein
MSERDIDKLAFGAVQLDRTGRVLAYNAAEGEICNRDPRAMIGKNFFTEVAPCTRSPQFYGRFAEGVRAGNLNSTFEYMFDYKMKPTKVKVHMAKSSGDTYWVLIKRL